MFGKYIVAYDEGKDMREGTKLGKQFRRRFRVPYCMFLSLVSKYTERHERAAVVEERTYDIRLKILVALRFLATGCSFDFLAECSMMSEETCRRFCQQFCEWMSRDLAPVYIKLPEQEEEVRHVVDLYTRLGLPGCVGSVDCVHIPWDKCPAGLKSSCVGKEGYPTLAFEVVVSHTRMILSVSKAFFGADNDKTIARYDAAIDAVKNGNLSIIEWTRKNSAGEEVTERGLYFICDGGYFDWKCLMSPVSHRPEGTGLDLWCKVVESVRKDVEW